MIQFDLRSLHARVGIFLPNYNEAETTFALQNAARRIAQDTLCMREICSVTLGALDLFPYTPVTTTGVDLVKIMGVKARDTATAGEFEELTEGNHPGRVLSERGSPTLWGSSSGDLTVYPQPSVDYDFEIEVAVVPRGEFTTVLLPPRSDDAMVLLAAGEILSRKPDTMKLGELYQGRGEAALSVLNGRSKFGDSGIPAWTMSGPYNYFGRRS